MWTPWQRWWRRPGSLARHERDRSDVDGDTSRVAQQCEAYVSGTYDAIWMGGPMPAWMRLNGLAHGDRRRLEDLAGRDRRRSGFGQTWTAATAFLAQEVLNVAEAEALPLAQIQWDVLLPLEEQYAGSPRAPRWPEDLAGRVLATLTAYRERRRRQHRAGTARRRSPRRGGDRRRRSPADRPLPRSAAAGPSEGRTDPP